MKTVLVKKEHSTGKDSWYPEFYLCPNCMEGSPDCGYLVRHYKFCPDCGVALTWEEKS